MTFKAKAEIQFEEKLAAALKNRDFTLLDKTLHQYGCYLELILPLPEQYGLVRQICDEIDATKAHEAHVWEADEEKFWCDPSIPKTAGDFVNIDMAQFATYQAWLENQLNLASRGMPMQFGPHSG